MTSKDILRLNPSEFEELCRQFLQNAGWDDVTAYGTSGGDKGRDFVANRRNVLVPGRTMIERWIIQCKRTQQLTQADLATEVAKVAQFTFDQYLLITSAIVTAGFRDSIAGLSKRYKINISVFDGPELCRLLDEEFPQVVPPALRELKNTTSIEKAAERLLGRVRVVPADCAPSIEPLLREYLRLGFIAKLSLYSGSKDHVFTSIKDGVFHAMTYGVAEPNAINRQCGGKLRKDLLNAAITASKSVIDAVHNSRVISLDWSDTLVDEVELDEFICESLAAVEGSSEWQAEHKIRFHRALWELHLNADPKWYDYGYLANLVGKTKAAVFGYHDKCNQKWGFFEGAREFLRFLEGRRKKTNAKFGIVTHCYRDILEYRAKHLGIDLGLFDFVLTGDQVADLNDKEELLQKALVMTKVRADQLVHIGDDIKRDILPATRIGCIGILSRFTLRRSQTFWSSAVPAFADLIAEIKNSQREDSSIGLISSFEQLQRILE